MNTQGVCDFMALHRLAWDSIQIIDNLFLPPLQQPKVIQNETENFDRISFCLLFQIGYKASGMQSVLKSRCIWIWWSEFDRLRLFKNSFGPYFNGLGHCLLYTSFSKQNLLFKRTAHHTCLSQRICIDVTHNRWECELILKNSNGFRHTSWVQLHSSIYSYLMHKHKL